jgi:hypothetical protein
MLAHNVCVLQVVGDASLELTLSQFWSSLGGSSIEVELSFHGLSVSPAAADISSGAAVTNNTLLLDAAAGPLKVRWFSSLFVGWPVAPAGCSLDECIAALQCPCLEGLWEAYAVFCGVCCIRQQSKQRACLQVIVGCPLRRQRMKPDAKVTHVLTNVRPNDTVSQPVVLDSPWTPACSAAPTACRSLLAALCAASA